MDLKHVCSMLTSPDHRGPRLPELDSLRGIAALVVFSSHSILLFPAIPHWFYLTLIAPTGLLLVGGHPAVLLFFLLSGFVLFLPYTTPSPQRPYWAYLAKRLCRIYCPYLAGVFFVVAVFLLSMEQVRPVGVSGFYSWHPLSRPEFWKLLANHILFVGSFHREYWNSSTWSLAEEMRISVIFPLLALALLRLGWRRALLIGVCCSLASSETILLVHHHFPLATLHYAAIFLLGAVLCSERTRLIAFWKRSSRLQQSAWVIAGILACTYPARLTERSPHLFTEEMGDWCNALGVSVFLIAALANTWFSRLLRHTSLQHLGRISYSFYLLHLPLLFVTVGLFWARLPHAFIPVLALIATFVSAELFYLVVERPSIALGKHLELRLSPQPIARHAPGSLLPRS